ARRRSGLLAVVLDRALRAHLGDVGVLAELLLGPALAQQVPALVELDLEVGEPGAFVLVVDARLRAQLVLLLDQGGDVLQDRRIVHAHSLPSDRRRPDTSSGSSVRRQPGSPGLNSPLAGEVAL